MVPRPQTRSLSPKAIIFCLLVAAAVRHLPAMDFTYEGSDCRLIYRFTPVTGTLNDLQVIYNDGSPFFPAYHGGITSFELGGERLKPREGRHVSQLLAESWEGSVYQAQFRWSYQNESFDFALEISLTGKTLTIRFRALAASAAVSEFGVDRSEDTPSPKVLVWPYGHNVLWTNNVFISAVLNPQMSQASYIRPLDRVVSPTSAYYSDQATYDLTASGRRNALNETLYLTVSPRVEDTFVTFGNPVSPYRDLLANKIVVDVWQNSFSETEANLAALASLGMKDLFVILHVWQRYGYDNGYPTTYPAGSLFGGPDALRRISDLCQNNGYLLALHTNYVDFYPNSEVWDSSSIALNGAGQLVQAWYNASTGIQSYLMKPDRTIAFARLYEPPIHGSYRTTAAYLDVHSAVLPSFKVDYDGRVGGAGQQKATFQAYRDLFAYVRSVHEGPLAGEGFGLAAPVWAGFIDAVEADPRSLFDVERGLEGSTVPTLVDYKLRALHGLFVPHGAGYLERFYQRPLPATTEKLERYRATELAFGNAGFLANPFVAGYPTVEMLREYCFLKHLQSFYLNATPVGISYWVGGEMLDASSALNRLLPAIENEELNDGLRESLAMVRVQYDNGLTLCVNRSSSTSWDVNGPQGQLTLPPGGFFAFHPSGFVAFAAIVGGVKSYFIWPAESACLGHLDEYLEAPSELNAVRQRVDGAGAHRYGVLLTWRAGPSNPSVARYRIYLGQGNDRRFLAEVDSRTFWYSDQSPGREDVAVYSVVAVNAEGRESEAASVVVR